MPITNYTETSRKATVLLKEAISYERSRKWIAAIVAYKKLCCLISPDSLPKDFSSPDDYLITLYEAYTHLGVAYQHIGDHESALKNFTRAIDVITKHKSVSLSGSRRTAAYMAAPVKCKRAFAFSALQDYKSAMKDVECAQTMDEKNLDLLCLEVLIQNSFGNYDQAMKLLVKGLSIDKSHKGCCILRSSLKAEGKSPKSDQVNIEGLDAVTTLRHPDAVDFVERYLHTMTVPHTSDVVCLSASMSSKSTSKSTLSCLQNRGQTTNSICRPQREENFDMHWKRATLSTIHPFKCGALPATFERNPAKEEYVHIDKHRRRTEYSSSLREYARNMRFMSNDEFINMLEKSNSLGRLSEWKSKQEKGLVSERVTIGVLQPINTKNVQRLYNRPWRGDRLQSAPLPVRDTQPIFYPAYS